jgi:hypothetical protein
MSLKAEGGNCIQTFLQENPKGSYNFGDVRVDGANHVE